MLRYDYARSGITWAGVSSLFFLLAHSLPVGAGEVPEACGNLPPSLKAMATAWNEAPARLESGKEAAVGRRFLAPLVPVAELGELAGRAAQRERAGRGIRLRLNLPAPGEYRVALDRRAWIELAEEDPGGRGLGAATSDKRLACAGIVKNLGFEALQAGPHMLQITEVQAEEADILVWPAAGLPAGIPK